MYRIKIATILFLILSLSGLILNKSLAKQYNSAEALALLNDSGVQPHSIELAYGSEIGQYNKEELLMLKRNLEKAFSTRVAAPEKPCCVEVAYQYLGNKEIGNNSLEIKLESVKESTNNNNLDKQKLKTYLIITYNLGAVTKENLTQSYNYLSNQLSSEGITPKINITIQGNLTRKLTHSEQLQFIKKMFAQANGKIISGLNEKDVISLTGYSNKLRGSTKSNDKAINLEIASRYDPLSKKTMITIGNPIITINY